jgi:hypothetical protein
VNFFIVLSPQAFIVLSNQQLSKLTIKKKIVSLQISVFSLIIPFIFFKLIDSEHDNKNIFTHKNLKAWTK